MNKKTGKTRSSGLLLRSAMGRLALAAVPLTMLWMAVAWALSLP